MRLTYGSLIAPALIPVCLRQEFTSDNGRLIDHVQSTVPEVHGMLK